LTRREATHGTVYEAGRGQLDFPKLRELLDRLASEGGFQEMEIEREFEGLGLRTMLINARGIPQDGQSGLILLAFEDITERKQEAEARYRRLFEATKDGIVITDAQTGEIQDVNPYVEQLVEVSRQELVGKRLGEADALGDVSELQAELGQIRAEGVMRFSELSLTRRRAGSSRRGDREYICREEKPGDSIQYSGHLRAQEVRAAASANPKAGELGNIGRRYRP